MDTKTFSCRPDLRRDSLFAVLAICLLAVWAPRPSLSLELDGFLKQCSSKTTVMGYDERGNLVKVGETLSGYCEGFLQGMLAAMVGFGME